MISAKKSNQLPVLFFDKSPTLFLLPTVLKIDYSILYSLLFLSVFEIDYFFTFREVIEY